MFTVLLALAFLFCVKAEYLLSNGKEVEIEEFPFQVSVNYLKVFIGGGVVIASKLILTAAHLRTGRDDVKSFEVRVGSTFHHQLGTVYSVQSFNTNAIPSPRIIHGDIGVIILENQIEFNRYAQLIPIVAEGRGPEDGEMLTVTGWDIEQLHQTGGHLRMARIPSIKRELCNEALNNLDNLELPSNMMCAGGGPSSVFMGGPGSPIINNQKQVVGIVSTEQTGGLKAGYPAFFVNLASPDMQKYVRSHLYARTVQWKTWNNWKAWNDTVLY